MKITSKDLIRLVQRHTLTGTVIDVSAMEGSGGGCYPSFRAVKGYINKVLSEDIGTEAYDLTNLSVDDPSQVPDNTYAFYYGDEGPALRSLNTGNELTLV